MNEYRKSYEYDDEDRGIAGFLLLFVLSFISFDLVAAIVLLSQSGMMVQAYLPLFHIPYLALWGIYFVCKLVFVIILFLKRKSAPKLARRFLAARIVLFVLAILILYVLLLKHGTNSPIHLADEMRSFWEITYALFLAPLVYTFGYSLGWMAYFKRSRRVRDTFGAEFQS